IQRNISHLLPVKTIFHIHPSFFFNDPATTEIYTLSLHDALPIYLAGADGLRFGCEFENPRDASVHWGFGDQEMCEYLGFAESGRSEEHTSELQSPCNLVCRLLLEKKKH